MGQPFLAVLPPPPLGIRCHPESIRRGDGPIRTYLPLRDLRYRFGGEAAYLSKLRRLLAKMEPGDQKLLLHMAQKVARD